MRVLWGSVALGMMVGVAGASPPIKPPSNTAAGQPKDGMAIVLVLSSPRKLEEGTDVTAQRMSVLVHLRNVSKKRRRIVTTDAPFYPRLEFVGPTGTRYFPTFLPPPMPRRGGPRRRRVTIKPARSILLGAVSTISGFAQSAGRKTRHLPMLPAGRYGVRVMDLLVAGVKGKLSSNVAKLVVGRSDKPIDGLQLTLQSRSRVTRKDRPTDIEIVFSNRKKKPIRLDLRRAKLELEVKGPSLSSERASRPRPSPPGSVSIIKPGGQLRFLLPFPGTVGERTFTLDGAGTYRLLLKLTVAANNSARASWSGVVRSRPILIELVGR